MKDYEIAIAHYLSNIFTDIVKNCKKEVEELLVDIDFSKITEFHSDSEKEIPQERFIKIYNDNCFVGNFISFNQHFFHIKSTTKNIIDDNDKLEYELKKRNFEIYNFNNMSISSTTLKKLETKSKKNSDIADLLSSIQSIIDDNKAKEDISYRLSIKKDDEIINTDNVNEVLSNLANQGNKNQISFFGASLYRILGVNIEQENELKITNKDKDLIMNFLTLNNKIKNKEEIQEALEKLNFNEKMNIMNIANVLQQICNNFVKSKNDYKENNNFYSKTVSYTIDKKTLLNNYTKDNLISLLRDECDFISLKTENTFEFNKGKKEKTYYIKSIAFTNIKDDDFKKYALLEKEQKELLNQTSVLNAVKNNNNFTYKNSIKMKPR